MTGVLIRRWPCEDQDTQEELHVKTEAQIRVRQLQAKECQGQTANHNKTKARKDYFTGFRDIVALSTP